MYKIVPSLTYLNDPNMNRNILENRTPCFWEHECDDEDVDYDMDSPPMYFATKAQAVYATHWYQNGYTLRQMARNLSLSENYVKDFQAFVQNNQAEWRRRFLEFTQIDWSGASDQAGWFQDQLSLSTW